MDGLEGRRVSAHAYSVMREGYGEGKRKEEDEEKMRCTRVGERKKIGRRRDGVGKKGR